MRQDRSDFIYGIAVGISIAGGYEKLPVNFDSKLREYMMGCEIEKFNQYLTLPTNEKVRAWTYLKTDSLKFDEVVKRVLDNPISGQ